MDHVGVADHARPRLTIGRSELPSTTADLHTLIDQAFAVEGYELDWLERVIAHARSLGDREAEAAGQVLYNHAASTRLSSSAVARSDRQTFEILNRADPERLSPWVSWLYQHTDARNRMVRDGPHSTIGAVRRVVDTADETGLAAIRLHSSSLVAWCHYAAGNYMEAAEWLGKGFKLAGSVVAPCTGNLLETAAELLIFYGDLASASKLHRLIDELPDKSAIIRSPERVVVGRAKAEAAMGQWAALKRSLQEADEITLSQDAQAHVASFRGQLLFELGQIGPAIESMRRAVELSSDVVNVGLLNQVSARLAEYQLRAGAAKDAIETTAHIDPETSLAADFLRATAVRARAHRRINDDGDSQAQAQAQWQTLVDGADGAGKVLNVIYSGPIGPLILGNLEHAQDPSRDDKIRRISHDARNIASSLILTGELLARSATDQQAAANRVVSSATHLIDQLARLDELEPTSVEARATGRAGGGPADLLPIVELTVASYAVQARRKSISVAMRIVGRPTPVETISPTDAQRITSNLISNAVKYCSSGHSVQVEIEFNAHTATIRVTDDGPGLTDEQLAGLFIAQSRMGPAPTAGEKSSGLGLAIVSQLAAEAGGTYSANSGGPGTGLTISVMLPIRLTSTAL